MSGISRAQARINSTVSGSTDQKRGVGLTRPHFKRRDNARPRHMRQAFHCPIEVQEATPFGRVRSHEQLGSFEAELAEIAFDRKSRSQRAIPQLSIFKKCCERISLAS
ncbi:hypothetical protein [Mesorhizobium sp. M0113]|uniref:hypothetical protein n=1 Tax=Mesorhizobium sp. M0113 TaxID=2956881 RepID=UPI0033377CB7